MRSKQNPAWLSLPCIKKIDGKGQRERGMWSWMQGEVVESRDHLSHKGTKWFLSFKRALGSMGCKVCPKNCFCLAPYLSLFCH